MRISVGSTTIAKWQFTGGDGRVLAVGASREMTPMQPVKLAAD
jgi:hypothetical protein